MRDSFGFRRLALRDHFGKVLDLHLFLGLRLFQNVFFVIKNLDDALGLLLWGCFHWALEGLADWQIWSLIMFVKLLIDEEVSTCVRLLGRDDVLAILDLLDHVVFVVLLRRFSHMMTNVMVMVGLITLIVLVVGTVLPF